MLNEGNQIHNFITSSGSGTVINYGSSSDFLASYGSGSTRQKVTVPVPQHCSQLPMRRFIFIRGRVRSQTRWSRNSRNWHIVWEFLRFLVLHHKYPNISPPCQCQFVKMDDANVLKKGIQNMESSLNNNNRHSTQRCRGTLSHCYRQFELLQQNRQETHGVQKFISTFTLMIQQVSYCFATIGQESTQVSQFANFLNDEKKYYQE